MRNSILISGLMYMFCGSASAEEFTINEPKLYCEDNARTESIGSPTYGRLRNGIVIDSTVCLESKTTSNFGTAEIADLLSDAACHMTYLTRTRLSVYDLSSSRGGRLKQHKSHQNGRDVDVGHFRITPTGYENSRGYLSSDTESLAVTWEFVKYVVDYPVGIEYIFWSPSNISKLHRYVESTWGQNEWKKYERVFFPERRHKRHMHIRINRPKEHQREMVAVYHGFQPR